MRSRAPMRDSVWRPGDCETAAILYVDTAGRATTKDPWTSVLQRCESPIEKTLAHALAKSGFYPMATPYRFEDLRARVTASDGAVLFLWSQEPMLRYRVDFLLVSYNAATDHCRRLVVECDGHDYHTPFAAQRRDEARDRELRPHVFGIIHLSGAEIMRNPAAIAGRLVTMLVQAEDGNEHGR
jgi:very-short-patch-repair endonuclease